MYIYTNVSYIQCKTPIRFDLNSVYQTVQKSSFGRKWCKIQIVCRAVYGISDISHSGDLLSCENLENVGKAGGYFIGWSEISCSWVVSFPRGRLGLDGEWMPCLFLCCHKERLNVLLHIFFPWELSPTSSELGASIFLLYNDSNYNI